MHKKRILLFLVGGFWILLSQSANAFYCEARGDTGAHGWGRSQSPERAKRIALSECAAHTPRRAMCRITFCEGHR